MALAPNVPLARGAHCLRECNGPWRGEGEGAFAVVGRTRRTTQEALSRKDVSTTMIYTHVLNRGGKGVRSPVDSL
jgi:hypothetical protein